ncbi:hypothetical protein J437_LFUL009015, partial [Ladona fulva]
STSDFQNIHGFKYLYCSLVCSIVYASYVRSPYQATNQTILENIQRKFIRLLAIKLHYPADSIPYIDIGLLSLQQRRNLNELLFLYRLVHSIIDCPYILQTVNFNVPPPKIRSKNIYKVTFYNND